MDVLPAGSSYDEFAENYLRPNRPCLFDQELTASWRARGLWQEKGKPRFEYLKKEFGDSKVPVTDCNDIQFSSHPKQIWSFAAYIDYWTQFNNTLTTSNAPSSSSDSERRLLYLKDWHFTRDYPDYIPYHTPHVFSSDWLNEVWDHYPPEQEQARDDYRFVYMGPKGTWTPFHVDVFRSYSWSVNVCGIKEWLIFSPGEEEHLRDKYGNLPIDVTSTELQDTTLYPNAHKAMEPLRVIQEMGQAIFIPSGWHHQVRNMEDTISINHNWTNGFGIIYTWKYLKAELNLVEKEIDDCQGMEGWSEQCQVILRSDAGMNISDFYRFMLAIIHPRLEALEKCIESLKQEKGLASPAFSSNYSPCGEPKVSEASFLLSLLPQDIASSSIFLTTPNRDMLYLVFELCTGNEILIDLKHNYAEQCSNCGSDTTDIKSNIEKVLLTLK